MSGPDERIAPGRRKLPELPEWAGPATRLVHAGRRPDFNAGSVVPPIYATSTFRYPAENSESASGGNLYEYTRYENPTQEVAAETIRELEGGEAARVFGSGMGAISTTLLSLLRPGDEIVALESLYGGTVNLLTHLLPELGVKVRWVPTDGSPEAAMTPGTKVVYLESPTNPTLRVSDLTRWSRAARAHGAVSVVDNTFATPVNQRPIAHGIDVVVHSASKYFGGHSDLIAGAVVGPKEIVERIRATHVVLGSSLDPIASFLLARGLRTLGVRVARQSASAAAIARKLPGVPGIASAHYPGSASEDEEQIARRQMSGRGGVVAFVVAAGDDAARAFLGRLRVIQPAASLGGVESLASLPVDTSHAHLTPSARAQRGIGPGMVRLSVGLEDPEDLLRDISEALGTP